MDDVGMSQNSGFDDFRRTFQPVILTEGQAGLAREEIRSRVPLDRPAHLACDSQGGEPLGQGFFCFSGQIGDHDIGIESRIPGIGLAVVKDAQGSPGHVRPRVQALGLEIPDDLRRRPVRNDIKALFPLFKTVAEKRNDGVFPFFPACVDQAQMVGRFEKSQRFRQPLLKGNIGKIPITHGRWSFSNRGLRRMLRNSTRDPWPRKPIWPRSFRRPG